ncbi:MAG: class II glutamine amidotransferase [Myxococcota bacterium]
MCRLFGFRSVLESSVHQSLISAENALVIQSEQHRDGWGLAYYMGGFPHVMKSPQFASQDPLFRHVSGVVCSHTVLAHVRKATQGACMLSNSHPFQYGPWTMAHNGDIVQFLQHRQQFIDRIASNLRPFVLGQTDSEVLFFLFLTHLQSFQEAHCPARQLDYAIQALQQTVAYVRETLCRQTVGQIEEPLTCIVTDGQVMLGMPAGRPLYISTYKKQCGQQNSCPFFQRACLHASRVGDQLTHFLLSSEPLKGENVWQPVPLQHIVAVDHNMRLHQTSWQPISSDQTATTAPPATS